MRHSGLSPQRFSSYYAKLLEKGFLEEIFVGEDRKLVVLTKKGAKYLRDYKTVLNFIREFEL